MSENSVVIKYLKSLGYNPMTSYYANIDIWKSWFKNFNKDFHEYHDQNGTKHEMYKLGMAKRLCEDWSSILYTERDSIVCENESNQEYLDKVLKELKFNELLPDNIETAFWSGTVGTVLRVDEVKIQNGELVPTEKSKYKLVSVDASQVIPLKVIDGKIVDVALISTSTIESENVYYIEIHTLTKDGYKVENKYINEKGEERTNSGVLSSYTTGSEIPLFNLLEPKIVNNIENNNGLGISVFANAIDQLKGVDIAYNNFVMDYYLGGKKVFYNKSLVRYENKRYTDAETGETIIEEIPIYPDDITKQQFMIVGDEAESINDKEYIHEFNPDLRETDNENGLNFALNLLAFKAGLGKSYYKFEGGSVATATQVILDNRDLVGNAKKHRTSVNDYAVGICRAILLLGRLLFKENLDENDEINLIDKDGFLQSEEDQKQQYMEEIASGLRSKTGYLMQFYGMSEGEALEELQLIQDEESGELFQEEYEDEEEPDEEFTEDDMTDLDAMLSETEEMLGDEE